ncbi:glycoside hydrolase family 3 C-terminal domain-containing protein [Streptomyces sp. NPDC006733]|uniref:glycoside hydrolase family 3 C-terminal domain-containing protein n=1 Tax=Streptomyces sp. NPDC006733 TaxID=3155460 RepID=UPI0033D27956
MTTDDLPFRDPRLPLAARVEDLIGRLTPDERIAMLHQFAPAVARLGLDAFRTGQEALHGVAWSGPATVFPQAVGLGASWDAELVRAVGEAVGTEVRAMRSRDARVGLNVWAPTVNLLRDPRWGRNEEGYAEDPRLTSDLATAYTAGLRGDDPEHWRTAPVLKHWLAHNNETARDTTSSSVRPRVLHEYDLPAFRGAVEAGAVAGVMPAYNLVNGRPNHLSPLLDEQLRRWTGQDLVVCSDAGAPSNLVDSEHYFDTHEEATAAALRAGVDSFTDHDQDSSKIIGRVRGALRQGLIDQKDVDTAVRRLLALRLRLGEFDPDGGPYAAVGPDSHDTPAHRALALRAAEAAVVLLKNDGLLPLDAAGPRTVAVIGPLADEVKTDWYSGSLIRRASLLDALRERLGADRVLFAEGADRIRLRTDDGWVQVPEAHDAAGPPGDEASLNPAHLTGRTDVPPVRLGDRPTELTVTQWGEGLLTLRAPSGRYLTVAEDGFVRAAADRPGGWVVQETFELQQHGDTHLLRHPGTGRYLQVTADGLKVAEQGTAFTVETTGHGVEEAARAAAAADTVIVVLGNDPHINGKETEDRRTLALPERQDALWRAAHAANPRTVLALTSSYPYAVAAADAALPALLWTAHGGQSAGTALARVLFGDVCPSGRLPQTWYAADEDLPDLLDYDIITAGSTYLYFRGTPLYPFGHGLSYTSFDHRDLALSLDGDTVRGTLTVTNTGGTAGTETVQLYAGAPATGVRRPARTLIAHGRLSLPPGGSGTLSFTVPLARLGFWDVAHGRWTVAPGGYDIHAGASSTDIRLTRTLTVGGEPPAPRDVRGRGLAGADFDEQSGVVLVDRTKERGDAVAPGGTEPGRLLFRACDFGGEGPGTVVARVAHEGTAGGASVELYLGDGTALATVDVPVTGGRYAYAEVRVPLDTAPAGVQDLHLTLHGPVRLDRLDFPGRAG